MATPTTTYSFSKPTVGGDDNAWGTELNNNLDKLDDLLDGTLSIAPNLVGWQVGGVAVTSTAAELNILDGVTASTAEINILDGVTSTTAELNILDGVTATASEINLLGGKSLSGSDTEIITGTAGTAGDIVQWNADGDLVSYGAATQLQAAWEAGTSTTESLVSPAKVKAEIVSTLNASGSAPVYACRAWVNFNGTGTVAIRASGNVSSITDNGTGNYTVNFATAMSDANYCTNVTALSAYSYPLSTATASVTVQTQIYTGVVDSSIVNVSIFR